MRAHFLSKKWIFCTAADSVHDYFLALFQIGVENPPTYQHAENRDRKAPEAHHTPLTALYTQIFNNVA